MKLFGNSKMALRVGIALGGIHFLWMLWYVFKAYSDTSDGQWFMIWELPYYVDFPLSAIFYRLMWRAGIYGPGFFYLIMGSIWYFYVPIIINECSRKMAITKMSRATVCIIMTLPILASWVYLLLMRYDFNYNVISYLEYGFVLIYAVLLVFAYVSNGKKKRKIMWLLLLVPYVCWFACVCLWFQFADKLELYYFTTVLYGLGFKIHEYLLIIVGLYLVYRVLKRMTRKHAE